MKKVFIVLILLGMMFHISTAFEAEGKIIFYEKGKIISLQPDERGREVISNIGETPAIASPDGKKIIFTCKNRIYIKEIDNKEVKPIYEGQKGDKIALISWLSDSQRFYFRKLNSNGKHHYFVLDVKENRIMDLGEFYEAPIISPSGKCWVYSTYDPNKPKCEVYGGLLGKKGNYVYDGRLTHFLSWDVEKEVVTYEIHDKIYSFDVIERYRQLFRLPFKDVKIVSFGYPYLVYYYKDQENKKKGILLYDPKSNEQTAVIDKKAIAFQIGYNVTHDKFLVFVPRDPKKIMGEGDVYLIEGNTGEATKLTRDVGYRVFNVINYNNQWSPDGKYIVYEKIRLKYSKYKKSEIFIAGEGKNEKFIKKMRFFRHPANPTWGSIK